MSEFIRHFTRDERGRWTCVTQAEVIAPAGRIQVTPGTTFARGTMFMNFDIAAALDEQYETERRHSA
jgi:hypothetical protein